MQVNGKCQDLDVRQVAEDQDFAFREALSIPHVKPGIDRNPES